MRIEEIDPDLKETAFAFFYWFSRFEFALKENKILKNYTLGSNAEPGWDDFVGQFKEQYQTSIESTKLLRLNPQKQVVGSMKSLSWRNIGLEDCHSELCKVVRLLKTIRNNLFHGGKHGADGWDNQIRTKELLSVGIKVLGQLAKIANFEEDYKRYY